MPDNSIFEKVAVKCKELYGADSVSIERLAESGSARYYFRLVLPSKTVILCVSDNIKENKTFLSLCKFLYKSGIRVPEIYAVDPDYNWYLIQDLGDTDFLSLLLKDKYGVLKGGISQAILKQLVKFQFLPKKEWKGIVEFSPLDRELIFYDFNYAVNNLFLVSEVKYNERRLKEEFNKLADKLVSFPKTLWGLMYRDFQSRNIMIFEDKPYFIDFQSARKGPIIYDFVSFAWQAKAGFSNTERMELAEIYVNCLEEKGVADSDLVKENIPYWALFRIIQTLGAYGLRGLKEGKPHFIQSIPLAVKNAIELMDDFSLRNDYPQLYLIMEQLQS